MKYTTKYATNRRMTSYVNRYLRGLLIERKLSPWGTTEEMITRLKPYADTSGDVSEALVLADVHSAHGTELSRPALTQIRDIDIIILSLLSRTDLLSMCLADHYLYNLYRDQYLWRVKIMRDIGVDLYGYVSPGQYRRVYLSLHRRTTFGQYVEAIKNSYLPLVAYLLEDSRLGCDRQWSLNYGIMRAAISGSNTMMEYLLVEGADVSTHNNMALYHAVFNGHLETVKLLLKHSASVNARTRTWYGTHGFLDVACVTDNPDMMKLLIDIGCIKLIGINQMLRNAVHADRLKSAAFLLDFGVNPYAGDESIFLETNSINTIQFLFDRGIIPDGVDIRNMVPSKKLMPVVISYLRTGRPVSGPP